MASSPKQFSLFLLLITLSSTLHIHARDAQFFNKISPTTNAANVVPEQDQPNFLPENDNAYGLYSHDSATTSTTAKSSQPLPENYNPAAYITDPENTEKSFFTSNPENDNNYGGSSFNSQPRWRSDAGFRGGATYNGPQGMSDTRLLENGKYFYDINTEKYSSNHPYGNESLRRIRPRNEFYNGNAYEFNSGNSMGGYQNQDEFEDEENNLP